MTRTRRKYNSEKWRRLAETTGNYMSIFGWYYHPYKVMPMAYQNEHAKDNHRRAFAREENRYHQREIAPYRVRHVKFNSYGKGFTW